MLLMILTCVAAPVGGWRVGNNNRSKQASSYKISTDNRKINEWDRQGTNRIHSIDERGPFSG